LRSTRGHDRTRARFLALAKLANTSFTSVANEADLLLTWMTTGLPNDVGRLEEEGWGDGQLEGLAGLEIDDQLEFGGLLDRQVGGFGAFEDAIHVCGNALPPLGRTCPIAHEPTCLDKRTVPEDRRQPVGEGELGEVGAMGKEGTAVPKYHQGASPLAARCGKRLVDRGEGLLPPAVPAVSLTAPGRGPPSP
jgi:hypothetical protein